MYIPTRCCSASRIYQICLPPRVLDALRGAHASEWTPIRVRFELFNTFNGISCFMLSIYVCFRCTLVRISQPQSLCVRDLPQGAIWLNLIDFSLISGLFSLAIIHVERAIEVECVATHRCPIRAIKL